MRADPRLPSPASCGRKGALFKGHTRKAGELPAEVPPRHDCPPPCGELSVRTPWGEPTPPEGYRTGNFLNFLALSRQDGKKRTGAFFPEDMHGSPALRLPRFPHIRTGRTRAEARKRVEPAGGEESRACGGVTACV